MTRATSKGAIALAMLCVAVGLFQVVQESIVAQDSAAADLILSNGKVVTVDDRFTIAQAVAIKGDRIVAVGSTQEIARLAGPGTKTIDLTGRTVIPGLIDNHLHLLRAGNTWELELRWDGVDSRKKAIETLRARAKAVGPGGWVFNIGGWAAAQFTDDRKPFTLAELDAIVGLDRLRVIHVNDSKAKRGTRLDRHANLGEGTIPIACFEALVGDARLAGIPKILETPHEDMKVARDLELLEALRAKKEGTGGGHGAPGRKRRSVRGG